MSIKLGDRTGDVGTLQQQLIEFGYPIDPAEAKSCTFGPSTQAAVEGFQHAHVGPDGHALAEDGIVGPFTLWAVAHPNGGLSQPITVPGWRRALNEPAAVHPVIEAAIGDIGKREDPDGSNDGPDLKKFHTGGLPWCCWAISTWYAAADGGSPFGRIGGVYTLEDWAKKHNKVVDGPPQAGDIFLILRPPSHGHTGLVVSLSDDGQSISTVSGNAANAVRALVRPVSSITLFVRPLSS